MKSSGTKREPGTGTPAELIAIIEGTLNGIIAAFLVPWSVVHPDHSSPHKCEGSSSARVGDLFRKMVSGVDLSSSFLPGPDAEYDRLERLIWRSLGVSNPRYRRERPAS